MTALPRPRIATVERREPVKKRRRERSADRLDGERRREDMEPTGRLRAIYRLRRDVSPVRRRFAGALNPSKVAR